MSGTEARGGHVILDYIGYSSPVEGDGGWMLQVLRRCVQRSGVREVHSHVEQFDGTESPLGFAAVVLIDESHVSAHCYSESGLLAIDIFTCGGSDPASLADDIHREVVEAVPGIELAGRKMLDRF
ncbi:MAG: S-adenosylmethionine decarboxylase [Candidatus Thermoplasmatota archaeon]|nr:S-adenosylmethionine decarboxylase [Candidatus Thermoplasmatota archaeon]MEE3315583.1 S-adenosylmethionine decarboxylase [Candidatus Thermoplasmatota archaeon]